MNSPPFDICNIEELVQLAPYAVVYVFQASIGLCVTTLQWTSYVSSKTILVLAVYLAGLTVLERKQTQSRIARLIGHVSHDALNRLAGQLKPMYEQMVLGLLLLLEAVTPGYLILDDVFIPKPFAHYVAGAYPGYDPRQKRHLVGQHIVVLLWTNGLFCLPVAFAFWPPILCSRASELPILLCALLTRADFFTVSAAAPASRPLSSVYFLYLARYDSSSSAFFAPLQILAPLTSTPMKFFVGCMRASPVAYSPLPHPSSRITE